MFERFSDEARHSVVAAQVEARLLQHGYIGTEHLLLGLIGEDRGLAATALARWGVTLAGARQAVATVVGAGFEADPDSHIPFTPGAKRALEMSLREAFDLGDRGIRTEHLLLGVVRYRDVADEVLVELGVDPADVRAAVLAARAGGPTTEHVPRLIGPTMPRYPQQRCSFCGRDLADVGRYVRGGADICEGCVAAATAALAAAEERGTDDPRTWLPPRVSGSGPADVAAAVAGIEAAVGVVRSTDVPRDGREAALEEPGDAAWVEAVHERWLGRAPDGRMIVQRLHFVDAHSAHLAVVLFTGLASGPVAQGHALRRDGRWVVGHDLVIALARTAGVRVPPADA